MKILAKIKEYLTLTPPRVQFDQFWVEIKKRNLWLIELRFGAVLLLVFLILLIYFLESQLPAFYINTFPLWIIALSILLYNLLFRKIWTYLSESPPKAKEFHSLHFALIQIITDFIALMLFIYFTGGIETPLYAFFIFHIIIGSLFLPGAVINILITVLWVVTFVMALLELNGIIPHQPIEGILPFSLYDNYFYLLIFFTLFGITLYLSSYLANSIAKTLYRRERALRQAYIDLENAEKEKSQYVMTVVHDLKTPITAAVTYLNMIVEGNFGELSKELMKPIERSVARLNGAINIINDILQISSLKLKNQLENLQGVRIADIFKEILEEYQILISSKKLNLSYCMADENIKVLADEKLLKLALSNLISNSIKYTDDEGTIEVNVFAGKSDAVILIADDGIGIPQNEIDKIFNEFFRTSTSKKRSIEGTGLGLSLVKQIIEKFDGVISVSSPSYLGTDEKRVGTEFTIKIPLAVDR